MPMTPVREYRFSEACREALCRHRAWMENMGISQPYDMLPSGSVKDWMVCVRVCQYSRQITVNRRNRKSHCLSGLIKSITLFSPDFIYVGVYIIRLNL
jgi:hypothetical protein